jgi:hypothetical protein
VILFLVVVVNQANVSLTLTVQTQLFVKIQNVEILVNHLMFAAAMQYAVLLVITLFVDVRKELEEIQKLPVNSLNVRKMESVIQENLVSILNVLILVHFQMLVAKMQFAQLKTTPEFAHVNQELLEILCLDVHKFNTVVVIINVQLEQNVTTEFAMLSAQIQEIASAIKCAFKMYVNLLVKVTQLVQIFNFVKTTDVLWNLNVPPMKIVTSTSNVLWIQMEDRNVNLCAADGSYVEETRNALPEITLLNVNASKDSTLMAKFAEKLNVKQIMIAAMTNVVKTTCVK